MGYSIPADHHQSFARDDDRGEPRQASPTPAKPDGYAEAINLLVADVHADNVRAGWWSDPATGESIVETRNVGELLMLIVSEVSEGMEGHRKGLMDDKLPHRPMLEVELADACIRIFDLAGAKGFDLGGAIAEKRVFNRTRPDHQLEARHQPGGKQY